MNPGALSELVELGQARDAVLEQAAPLGVERVALRDGLGRRLAEDAAASEPVPAFDNSAMDGFAVRAADTRGARPGGPVRLRLVGESRAGHPAAATLRPGEAIGISTGAVVPAGADGVVRVEATRAEDDRVLVEDEIEPGRDVRRAGEDVRPGETVLVAGTRIGPAELGVLASLGAASVSCRRRPRVAVLTGGDELLEPADEMRPGGVRNSNAYSVPALVERAGGEAVPTGSVPDELEATRTAIEPALECDVVVVCGGVSVGEHDYVKQAFSELGVKQSFWGVALKPGKPTWFGTRGDALVFGLPGNPVSAMVTFTLLVRPALEALAGGRPERLRTTARLASAYEKRRGRTHAVRCRLELGDDGWHSHPFERQGSHVLTSMLGADCLALLPSAAGSVSAGERVEVELLDRG
ncbi:MAG TPA: gephyrin-like molybdotransferase Glp [Solirubrobacterales bacterium]|nr:gephyrin-like molybdotransferase Glp [Solirubrobacterales bacterium]